MFIRRRDRNYRRAAVDAFSAKLLVQAVRRTRTRFVDQYEVSFHVEIGKRSLHDYLLKSDVVKVRAPFFRKLWSSRFLVEEAVSATGSIDFAFTS